MLERALRPEMTAQRASAAPSQRVDHPRITVLVDNDRALAGLEREHGLSLWVEAGDARVLIDTGETTAFRQNAAALGVDLGTADAVALSHGHYDHSGGLPAALEAAPAARLHLHPAALQPRFARRRRGRPEPIGMPDASRAAAVAAAHRIVWTAGPTAIVPGVWCTGPVPRDDAREPGDRDFFFDAACTMPDPVPDDQSFWIDTPDGLWVVLGCAHAGVLATLEHIGRLTNGRPLARLLGGMHLSRASEERIALIAADLAGRAPSMLAPCHCTGRAAPAVFRQTLPSAVAPLGSGAVVE
jgi:7,8-dihydropterin-6-yl-methyl-4-(beta-D-ribofuranosyl)aminobenzene 5'-phosphate synthase